MLHNKSKNVLIVAYVCMIFPSFPTCFQHMIFLECYNVIVQTRVGRLPPISKHREELKIQGEAKYFLTNFEVF